MVASAIRYSCRFVRRGSEHDHDSSWTSGLVVWSLFELGSGPRGVADVSATLCGFVGVVGWVGADWGCKQFASDDEGAIGRFREGNRPIFPYAGVVFNPGTAHDGNGSVLATAWAYKVYGVT